MNTGSFCPACARGVPARPGRRQAGHWTNALLLAEPLTPSKHNLGYLQSKSLLCGMSIWRGSASISLQAKGEFLGLVGRKAIQGKIAGAVWHFLPPG